MIVSAALGAFLFACLGAAGLVAATLLTSGVQPFEDGPRPGRPPSLLLLAGAGAIGIVLATHGLTPFDLAVAGLATGVLVACWSTDVIAGIIPDVLTLVPLGALIALQLAHGSFVILLSVLVPALPFAAGAILSKGRGIGWGDVKLAALGGALIGMTDAVVALGFASLVCGVAARYVLKRREAVAFAPFLCAAIGISLAVRAVLA